MIRTVIVWDARTNETRVEAAQVDGVTDAIARIEYGHGVVVELSPKTAPVARTRLAPHPERAPSAAPTSLNRASPVAQKPMF